MYGSCLVGFAPRLPLVLINGAMCAFAALCPAAREDALGTCMIGFAPRLPLASSAGAMYAFAALCLAAPVGAGVMYFAIVGDFSSRVDCAYGETRAVA